MDIFENLDNFLENYDENNLSSTSTLSYTEGNIENDALANDRSRRQSRRSVTKTHNTSAGRKSLSNRNRSAITSATSITSPTDSSSVPIASTPAPVDSTVDMTGATLSTIAEEMQSLGSLFQSIFNSKNPTVKELLKDKGVGQIKRSFTTLNNGYNRKPPVTANEVTKLRTKIDSVRVNLNKLEQMIKSASVPASTDQARSRSRPLRNTRQANSQLCPPVVISLDCDDDPVPMTTRFIAANNIISLDSDDEGFTCDQAQLDNSLTANSSFETENYIMRIKVKWFGGIETFEHRRFQKFADIFAKLAEKNSVNSACIMLNLNDSIVHPSDTPDSINYKPNQFISGRIFRGEAPALPVTVAPSATNNNTITLKIQMDTRKQPLRLQIDKQQTMSVLVIKCAEELNCQPKDIKLYFDGEQIDTSSKPEDLDLEGDEILDIRMAKRA